MNDTYITEAYPAEHYEALDKIVEDAVVELIAKILEEHHKYPDVREETILQTIIALTALVCERVLRHMGNSIENIHILHSIFQKTLAFNLEKLSTPQDETRETESSILGREKE